MGRWNHHQKRTNLSRIFAKRRICVAAFVFLGALLLRIGFGHASEAAAPVVGSWNIAVTADEERERRESINQATKNLRSMQRNMARQMLERRTAPPEALRIELDAPTVTIGSDDRELELELGGAPIAFSGDDGTAQVRAKMDGDQLIVTANGNNGGRTTSYRADGVRLSVFVSVTGSRLDGTVRYSTTYTRAE